MLREELLELMVMREESLFSGHVAAGRSVQAQWMPHICEHMGSSN